LVWVRARTAPLSRATLAGLFTSGLEALFESPGMPCQVTGCDVDGQGPCLLTSDQLIANPSNPLLVNQETLFCVCGHSVLRHTNTAPSPPPVAVGTFRHVEALSHEPLHARTALGFHGDDGFCLHVTSPHPRAHVPRFATLWSPLVASGRLHGVVCFSQSSFLGFMRMALSPFLFFVPWH
jgi:hypothetical protein